MVYPRDYSAKSVWQVVNIDPYYDYSQENQEGSSQTSESTDNRYWEELDRRKRSRSNIEMNETFVPLSDSSTESLYIPVLITSYRLYSVLDDVDYTDDLVETDNDLTDEPDNDYHTHDYDVQDDVNVSVRNKRGQLKILFSTS